MLPRRIWFEFWVDSLFPSGNLGSDSEDKDLHQSDN